MDIFHQFRLRTASINLQPTVIFFIYLSILPKMNTSILTAKPKEISSLRKRASKLEPVQLLRVEQECAMFSTLSITPSTNTEPQTFRQEHDVTKFSECQLSVPLRNKIYNNTTKTKQVSLFDQSRRDVRHNTRNTATTQTASKRQNLQARPCSSNTQKIPKTIEIFKTNTDVLNFEHRPGSSKSSRLFKKKGSMVNDTIDCENDEGELLIRVTSFGSRRSSDKSAKRRIGTSLSHNREYHKIPTHLDPQFVKLFAQ